MNQEFENWAVIALGGIPNKVQVGDMGVDGRIYPVSSAAAPRNSPLAQTLEEELENYQMATPVRDAKP